MPPPSFVYATNRLISLYLGALADPGKAMGELRRLIDRYPASDVAVHARKALADLKREMPQSEGSASPARNLATLDFLYSA